MLFDVTDSTSYSEVGDVALRKLLQQFPAIDPTPVCFAGYRKTSSGGLSETDPFVSSGFGQTFFLNVPHLSTA